MRSWDIYEITTDETPIKGVMLRGRIRKFAIQNEIELLTENATDTENTVRFAIEHGSDTADIQSFLPKLVADSSTELVMKDVINPVLSKLKVNLEERYEI